MVHALKRLSLKYQNLFTWKFSAISHRKGIVDGIGRNVKLVVRTKTFSKGKNPAVVQNAKDFA